MKNLHYGIIIPARYNSSRLPGKPLIDLNGKTMIQRTWERCCQAVEDEKIYVATDNELIAQHVRNFGGKVTLTSSECITGTDRVAQANNKLNFDFVINVQGDEPIINPMDIRKIIENYLENPNMVNNGIAPILSEEEFRSNSIPKVVCSNSDELLYMSRSPIPGNKNSEFQYGFKQICIYAFGKEHLDFFIQNPKKTALEDTEDIEILRFIEHGIKVKMTPLSGTSLAIDEEKDVEKVIKIIKQNEISV